MKKHIVYIVFLLITTLSYAAEVEFKASAPKAVEVGEQFRLVYTLNEEGKDLQLPELPDFDFLGGPQTSSQSSFNMVNGKVSKSYTLTYSLYYRAKKEGTFTIPSAQVKVGRKTYSSNTLQIQVVKGAQQATPPPSGQGNNKTGGQQQNQATNGSDLFISVLVSDRDVYQGEHLVVTLKIYSKLNLSGLDQVELPSFSGFYKQEIETQPLTSLTRETINGVVYGTGVLKRYILYPQRSGQLTIDEASINATYQVRVQQSRSRSIFDDFFSQGYKNVEKKLYTKPVTINVKPLPANKPASFSGAVGKLSMTASINKTEAKSNDAITLKVTINGNGNIKLIDPPKVDFPPDFEVYDPKTNLSVNNTIAGQSGTKTFEYLIIPRHAGNFRIPPVEFTYFNTSSNSFKTIPSQEFNLEISKGEETETGQVVSGLSKEEVKFIGKDIRYLHPDLNLKTLHNEFFGSNHFYFSYIIALLIFILIIIVQRNRIKNNADIWRVKNKKANSLAKARLKNAAKHLKEQNREAFYEEIAKAMWGYMSDKLGIPVADLSHENVTSSLKNKEVEESIIQDYKSIIEDGDFARYAPASQAVDMNELYERAIKSISKLEQKL